MMFLALWSIPSGDLSSRGDLLPSRQPPVRLRPLPRIPCYGKSADSLEPNPRVIGLHQCDQSPTSEQKTSRCRLDAVENRLRQLWLRMRENVVPAEDDQHSSFVRHRQLSNAIHPRGEVLSIVVGKVQRLLRVDVKFGRARPGRAVELVDRVAVLP